MRFGTQEPVAEIMAFLGQLSVVQEDDLGLSVGAQLLDLTLIFISGGASSLSHSVSEPPSPDLEVYK